MACIMCSKYIYLLFIVIISVALVNCQLPNDLDVDDLEKKVHEIPGLENFNSSSMPTAADLEKVLKEKCRQNSGNDEAFDALQTHQTTLKECIESHLNATQIQIEVEEAKKTGSMDEVFGKYCKKYPEIYNCVEGATESMKACLNNEEKEALDKAINITNELKDFICYKDGDRIAMFVAEGGIECLNSSQQDLQVCANKTLGARIPTELTLATLPTFLFTEKDCEDFQKIRTCVNKELGKCKDSTPANIVDAFFKFLKKKMTCVESLEADTVRQPSAASQFSYSVIVLIVPLLMCKLGS